MTINVVHTLSGDTKQFVTTLADAIRHTMSMQLKLLMSKLDTFISDTATHLASIDAALDGVSGDLDGLKAEIVNLKNSLGDPTPEQQAALDNLSRHVADIDARTQNIDSLTPPVAPVEKSKG